MARNIEPLKARGYGNNPSFPLTPSPFNSRVESELSFAGGGGANSPKNYQFVAYRPGFPLQASELNEIQEHFQMQMTLNLNMMNSWITSGAGPMWSGFDENIPGDGVAFDADFDASIPNTGLGVGGGSVGDVVDHNKQYAISGPGWRGSTPLWPFNCPYVPTDNSGFGGKLVEANITFGSLTIQFYSGWYLVDLPQINPDTSDASFISGLKHWVYLDTSFPDATPDPQYSVSLDLTQYNETDIWIPIGLNISTGYVDCNCTDNNTCDENLGDNAAGYSNSVACGASRYMVNIEGAGVGVPNPLQPEHYNKLSLVCKVNPYSKTVRYMNNIILYKGS
jgi:hypothetical protein